MGKRKNSGPGNPARAADPFPGEVLALYKRMVTLLPEMEKRLNDDAVWHVKGACFAVLCAYADMAGLPSPLDVRAAEMGWDKVK